MTVLRTLTFALTAVALMTACSKRFSWHQKLTVTVETPAGEVSGSSVTEVVVFSLPKTLPDAGVVDASLHGEAVVVEVSPGRYLFVLLSNRLSGQDGVGWAENAYDANKVGSVFEKNMRFIEAQAGEPPIALKPDLYPLMVTFDDLSDSMTVRKVDPANLAATFGPGVSLKSVMFSITDEPVTTGRIDSLLPWLGPYPEPGLGPATGRTTNIPFYRMVHMGDFIRRSK